MRYAPGHRQATKTRILHAAGRRFRAMGYGGIGVDGLAQDAGVTSGAFYGHFRSKAEAFREAVVAGMEELKEGIISFRDEHGRSWVSSFTAFYFGPKLRCEMEEGCALPSLSPEVSRGGDDVRRAFETEVTDIATMIADGLSEPQPCGMTRQESAWVMLALMSGGTTLARAVHDEAKAAEIARAVSRAVTAIGAPGLVEAAAVNAD
jgi:TetR/AcrR family transcriptional repressor of nem operon